VGATLQLADSLDRLVYGERDVLSLDTAHLPEDMELSFSLDRKPVTAAEYRRFVEHFIVFVGTLGSNVGSIRGSRHFASSTRSTTATWMRCMRC
jgi:hypothetical protein